MDLFRYRVLMLSGAALASIGAGFAVAGPNGGTVVGGGATIQGQGTGSVIINQTTQNTIINWATFNIGQGETTTFNQPNSSSVALNRVIGGQGPSFLDGTLTANGRVFIVNGDGILFGSHSSVTTAGFLASTNDIRNEDFMAGKYNFNIPGLPNASIVNLGSITATSGGFAALVAPGVRNAGTITATLGTVSLASGNAFTLDFYGDRLITLALNDQIAAVVKDVQTGQTLQSLVGNSGKLSASGGRVQLTAAAARAVVDSVINNTGVIEADTIGTQNGMIVLGAATGASKPADAPVQTVRLAGTISAAGKDKGTKGGTVVVAGEAIGLAGASIDVSGRAGGGKALIGGDTGGGKRNPAAASIELAKLETFVIPTAASVSVDAASVIKASATDKGNGGKVVLWSDQRTTFAGTILARGGANGGNGGFVETSSHGQLNFTGTVDLRAPLGKVGTLLLDPADIYIVTTLGGSPAGASEMTNVDLQGQLALSDVTITTSTDPAGQHGDIFVNSSIAWANSSSLTLNAFRNISISDGVTIANSGSGNLTLRSDSTGTGVGTISFLGSSKADFSGSTGYVTLISNPLPPAPSPSVLTNPAIANQLNSYTLDPTAPGLGIVVPRNDDGSTSYNITSIFPHGINFGGQIYTSIWVNTNGSVSFSAPVSQFTPTLITPNSVGMIAPFWADVDTRVGNPIYVSFNTVTQVLTVNWKNVGYYNEQTNPTNSFQLQLSNRNNGNFDAGFIYTSIGWTAGQASGGVGGLGGTPARAGFTYGNGDATNQFELPQSGNQAALLNLPNTPGNTGVNGVWSFAFRNGVPSIVNYSVANASSTYGSFATLGAVTLTGVASGDTVTSTIELFSGSTPITLSANTPAGTYTEVVTALSNPNYTIASSGNTNGILTINPATLTYTANPTSRTYGAVHPPLTGTVSGFVAGDTQASATTGSLSFTTTATASSNVGSYAVTGGGLTANNGNYVFVQATTNTNALTINPAPITVTALGGSSIYGDSPSNPGLSATGLQNGQGVDVLTGLSNGFGITNLTNAGSHTLSVAGLLTNPNYTVTTVNTGTWAVNPATLTYVANAASSTYGAAIPALTGSVTGFVSDQTLGSVTTGSLGFSTAATPSSNVGSYAIIGGGLTANNGNYVFVQAPANATALTMNPAPITVTALGGSSIYGDSPSNPGLSATGLQNGQGVGVLTGLSNSFGITNLTNAGSYTLSVVGALTNLNYTVTSANTGTWAVNPATLTYVAKAASSTYGAAIPALTGSVTGFVNDQTLASETTGSLGFATGATPSSNVGSYAITGSGLTANNGNYVFAQAPANATALTINPAPITVTALGGSSIYGDSPSNPGLSATGLQNGQGVGVLTGLSNSFGITNLTNAGNYALNVAGTLTNPNYTVTFANTGTWVVNPATLTYVANPTSISSGSGIPVLGGTVTGLVNSDSLSSVAIGSPGFTTLATGNSASGSYPINGEGLTVTSSNYVLVQAPANATALTINPGNTGNISPPEALIFQNLLQNVSLAPLSLGEVVNIQPVNQPPPGAPHPGSGPPSPPGGLPPQFGARFFTPPPIGETHFVQNEVVLQIPSNIPYSRVQSIMALLGLTILGTQDLGLLGVTCYRVHIDNGASIGSVTQALAGYQIIAGAQANYTYGLVQGQTLAQGQEPDLAGLTQGEGDAAQYAIGKLGLIDIHRQLKGGNISVAVIDSQIDTKHPDLDGVVAEQFDAVGEPDAPHSHGTGMAGAIFAHRKLMGIAPSARLYAIHAFSSGAASAESTTFNILKGLEWASAKGVRVINMSFAGPRDPSLERALKAAHDKGIVLIAAAGNAGPKSPPLYPGADPNVIAVTATDVNDKLFSGANRGRYIAVAAPGVDILVPAPDNTYQLTTGTSVASAEVSGLAALLLERNPSLGPEDVRRILTSSARRLGAKDRDDDFGSGLIDPSKAVQTAGDFKPLDVTGAVPPRSPAPQASSPPPARPAVVPVSHPGGTLPRPVR